MKPYLYLLLLICCVLKANGQATNHSFENTDPDDKKYLRIEFNQKGQLIAAPPDVLTNKTIFRIVVKCDSDFRQQQVLAYYNRYMKTLSQLSAMDPAKKAPKVLVDMGLENSPHAKLLLEITEQKIAQSLLKFMSSPFNQNFLKTQGAFDDDTAKLKTYINVPASKETAPLEQLVQLPSADDLLYPGFTFIANLYNSNGLGNKIVCEKVKPLHIDTSCDCGLVYTDTISFDRFTDGPVQYNYELRTSAHYFTAITKQLNNDKALLKAWTKTDAKTFVTQVNDLLNFKALTDTTKVISAGDLVQFKKYVDLKVAGKMDEKTDQDTRKMLTKDKIAAMLSNLQLLKAKIDPFRSDQALATLLQMSWLTNGAITANPTYVAGLTAAQKKLAALNTSLLVAQKDSTDKVKQLAFLESPGKTATTPCCNADAQAASLDLYKKVQLDIRANSDQIDTLRKHIKDAKKAVSQADMNGQGSKATLFSDSLLYAGFLYSNIQIGDSRRNNGHVFRPDLYYYAFMRHHDALHDMHLMGRDPISAINEKQRIFVLVENSNDKAKYILKTTITYVDPGDIHDQMASELGAKSTAAATKAAGSGGDTSKNTLEALYSAYKDVATDASHIALIFAPYQNGILKLPYQETKDKTPDFFTYNVEHERPAHGQAYPVYAVSDPTGKNLNSESTTYTYGFDKLFRFRLKAGLTYSSFEGRSYTLNAATNTATYVNTWAGLAPSIGVQVFTSPIDVLSKRAFPTGAWPFLYAGYLFDNVPGNNLLVGGGWEIYSGFSITAGAHFARTQRLSLTEGTLQTQDYYKPGVFVSLSIGLETFNLIFNAAKTTVNPFKAP